MAAVGLVATDVAATAAFDALLGLEFTDPVGSGQHLEAVAASGFRIMIDAEDMVRGFDSGWNRGEGHGRARLAVDCGEPALVDQCHEEAVTAGHRSHLAPFDAFWGQRHAALLDPDGTIVDLFADHPSPAQGGAAGS